MGRDIIRCCYCGGTIGLHWQLFDHITCTPPADVSAEELKRQGWQLEKTLNRVGRTLERLTR
jgi:hypothetical protein